MDPVGIKDLTLQERKFLKLFNEHPELNQTEVYKKLRPEVREGSAGTLAARMITRINGKVPWEELMDYMGLSEAHISRKTRELMEAKTLREIVKTEVVEIKTKDGEVRDKKTITIRNTETVEDNSTQMRATELASDQRGLRKQKTEIESPGLLRIAIAEIEKPGNTGMSDDKGD